MSHHLTRLITVQKLISKFTSLTLLSALLAFIAFPTLFLLGCNQMLIANQGAGERAIGTLTPQSPTVNTDLDTTATLVLPAIVPATPLP